MRWRLRRRTGEDERARRDQLIRAEQELRAADHDLEAARERTSEIMEISRTLRRLGEQNHFAPMVLEAFGGER